MLKSHILKLKCFIQSKRLKLRVSHVKYLNYTILSHVNVLTVLSFALYEMKNLAHINKNDLIHTIMISKLFKTNMSTK